MDLKDVLAQALKLEQDGEAFYTQMARSVTDEETKAMFEQLAKDEIDHYNYIQRQFRQLEAGGDWEPIPEMEMVTQLDAVSLVFPSGQNAPATLPSNPTEEDALLFGLAIEDKSFKLYYNSAQQAQEEAATTLFLQLAAAEQRHFEVLMQRYQSRFGYPR